jgi:antitoxin component of MazEF toxin-antitoxin module
MDRALTRVKRSGVGNSRGVRLPAGVLRRYGMEHHVQAELMPDGVLLKPARSRPDKLSWRDAARAMNAAGEDWSEWETTVGDGLDRL